MGWKETLKRSLDVQRGRRVMQLRECEYILAIAQEGNMGKAAQRLYVSQPTLSKMLAKLEENIGMPLFERQSTGMVPTAAGTAYIEGARRMIELNAQWEQEINAASGNHPFLDIGIPMVRLDVVVYYVLPRLARRFPGLQTHSSHTPQSKLVVDLINNKCALGLGIIKEKYSHILNNVIVGEEEYVLVVPKGHPLERKARPKAGCRYPHVEVSQLKDTPFVISRPDAYSARVTQRFFSDNDITPPIAMRMQNTGNIMKAVAGGAGVALLPSQPLSAMGAADKLAYLHVDVHEQPMQIGVLYRRGYALSLIEKAFIADLREAYRQS